MLPSADGSVTVGGEFSEVAGRISRNVARLRSDGSIDPDYIAGRQSSPGIVNDVVSVGDDGSVLLATEEASGGTDNPGGLMRRNPDGTLDTSFGFPMSEALGPDRPIVNRLWRFADGRYLVAGNYRRVRGEPHAFLTRIFDDSTVDETFTATPDGEVFAIAEDAQERLLVSGLFTQINGQPVPGFARLLRTNDVPVVRTPPASGEAVVGGLKRIQPDVVGGTSYTWSKNGVDLFTSTSPGLALVSATLADAGMYTLRAENRFGAIELDPVWISVSAASQARLDPSLSVDDPILTQPNRNLTRLPDGRWAAFDPERLRLQLYSNHLTPIEHLDLTGVLRSIRATTIVGGQAGDFWIAGVFEVSPDQLRGLIHVNADGSVDPTFVVTDPDDVERLYLAPGERIYATRRSGTDAYDRQGNPIPGQSDLSWIGFTLRSDGRYYLNTNWPHAYGHLDVVRYHADGTEDTGFKAPKITIPGQFGPVNVETVTDIAALPDGGLVVAAFGNSTTGAVLLWLEADGRLQRLHHVKPVQSWDIIAVAPDGGVLAASSHSSGPVEFVHFAPGGLNPTQVLTKPWPMPPVQAWADETSITLVLGMPGTYQKRDAYRVLLPTGRGTSRLVNLSGRGYTGSGDDTLIVGYVTAGSVPGEVLVRGIGPGLRAFKIEGTAENPLLTLHRGDARVDTNDDWDVSSDLGAALAAAADRHGAFALEPGKGDAALALTSPSAAYTAHLDAGGAPGVALGEIFANTPGSHRLVNLSLRGVVGDGERSLIGGFVVSGDRPRWMLLRAVGPTLREFGIAAPVADVSMSLVKDGRVISSNDNWSDDGAQAVIEAAGRRTGAFALPPNSRDAALLVELSPGVYTCVVTPSAGASPAVGLLEIYHIDD